MVLDLDFEGGEGVVGWADYYTHCTIRMMRHSENKLPGSGTQYAGLVLLDTMVKGFE